MAEELQLQRYLVFKPTDRGIRPLQLYVVKKPLFFKCNTAFLGLFSFRRFTLATSEIQLPSSNVASSDIPQ